MGVDAKNPPRGSGEAGHHSANASRLDLPRPEFSACHDPNLPPPLRIHVGMSPVEQDFWERTFKRCPFAIILETEGTSTSQTSALSAQLPPRTHDCGNRIT
jgi:hypothetical protein